MPDPPEGDRRNASFTWIATHTLPLMHPTVTCSFIKTGDGKEQNHPASTIPG
ncbi:MAG: hypothetical protein HC840_21435 [Leptolyngbyaceae cyanobacterium RM2_2_4]|nr:hypothetical protein [Leptolyngbyaceae cyanobacterium SM1_4_3]NJN91977.1 hypothetical protein [Leptolyngbyaceae cyanobacterium SL_5_14]NJO51563.1 hypothetical protein [Leptolyngbyaceae cyanobacterium RM2_2_4]NJO66732.1 hypothetical protein [Leptolyngbyaceae cyanobacterium RM1_405_57]